MKKHFYAIIIFAVIGLGNAGYLTYIHYMVHIDPTHQSACAISAKVNCDIVAASEFSSLVGVPISVYGILGYLAFMVFAFLGLRPRREEQEAPLGLIFWMGVGTLLVSAYLAYISTFILRTLCIHCTIMYAVNLGIIITSYLTLVHRRKGPFATLARDVKWLFKNWKPVGAVASIALSLIILLMLIYPRLYTTTHRPNPVVKSQKCLEVTHEPCLGPRDAPVIFIEYSDYQCYFCRRAHNMVRFVLGAFKGKVRFVHRHYPLDHKCHPLLKGEPFHAHACTAALGAICAKEQKRFWPFNDALWRRQSGMNKDTPSEIAAKLKLNMAKFKACMKSKEARKILDLDIMHGMKAGIKGTPTFFINERKYKGAFRSPGMIRQAINRALEELSLSRSKGKRKGDCPTCKRARSVK